MHACMSWMWWMWRKGLAHPGQDQRQQHAARGADQPHDDRKVRDQDDEEDGEQHQPAPQPGRDGCPDRGGGGGGGWWWWRWWQDGGGGSGGGGRVAGEPGVPSDRNRIASTDQHPSATASATGTAYAQGLNNEPNPKPAFTPRLCRWRSRVCVRLCSAVFDCASPSLVIEPRQAELVDRMCEGRNV